MFASKLLWDYVPMVQNVYVGPVGGRRQVDRVVWLGGGRAWGWGRSAGVLGPRARASLVLVRRLAGTIEKSTPSVSWRFGALRLWLRRGPDIPRVCPLSPQL